MHANHSYFKGSATLLTLLKRDNASVDQILVEFLRSLSSH